jgi:hypothetical protein
MTIEVYVASDRNPIIHRVRPSIIEYTGSSRIWPYAQEILEEGIDGLREVRGRVNKGRNLYPHEIRQQIATEESVERSFKLNLAGVVMGASIHSIEDMLSEGSFSPTRLTRTYNAAVADLGLGLEIDSSFSPDRKLETKELQILYRIAKADKTLSEFFAAINFSVLPEEMRRLIEGSGTLDEIRSVLGPIYKKKTKNLLAGRRIDGQYVTKSLT